MSSHTYGFDLLGFLTFPLLPCEFAVRAIETMQLNHRFVFSDALLMLTVFAAMLVIVWFLIGFLLSRSPTPNDQPNGRASD
jgi:hypothetical protein